METPSWAKFASGMYVREGNAYCTTAWTDITRSTRGMCLHGVENDCACVDVETDFPSRRKAPTEKYPPDARDLNWNCAIWYSEDVEKNQRCLATGSLIDAGAHSVPINLTLMLQERGDEGQQVNNWRLQRRRSASRRWLRPSLHLS